VAYQSTKTKLTVTIKSLKKLYFEGSALSITGLNDKGEFDVLPEHINFISLIKNYIIIDKGLKSEQKLVISNGILRVKENRVEVFLEV
jgi:F0F1-type ATP synthase epsilon subunit